jgi:hypothetical protein
VRPLVENVKMLFLMLMNVCDAFPFPILPPYES